MNFENPASHSAAHEQNRRIWDGRARKQQRFTRPAENGDFAEPLQAVDGLGWLGGDVSGKRLLCLAAGGGRQGPLYAAAGAHVTVVDISSAMLDLDRQVAAERRLSMRTIQASMDDLSIFKESEFEIVVHPVSSCYVPDVSLVYREVARVCVSGGLYISQHKQPGSLQAEVKPLPAGYSLIEPYYREGSLPQVNGSVHREEGTLEYLHRWEQLVGGMCRAGFAIEDLVEPLHADPKATVGTFGHRSRYVAPYVRIKARRVGIPGDARGRLWAP